MRARFKCGRSCMLNNTLTETCTFKERYALYRSYPCLRGLRRDCSRIQAICNAGSLPYIRFLSSSICQHHQELIAYISKLDQKSMMRRDNIVSFGLNTGSNAKNIIHISCPSIPSHDEETFHLLDRKTAFTQLWSLLELL